MTQPSLCVLLLLTLAAPAAAQTRRGFVEGGFLADYDPTLGADDATTAGVTGSAGLFITPRWSLRLEIDYMQWHGSHRSGETRVVDHEPARPDSADSRAHLWGAQRTHLAGVRASSRGAAVARLTSVGCASWRRRCRCRPRRRRLGRGKPSPAVHSPSAHAMMRAAAVMLAFCRPRMR